jgi:hypothetical protein
MSIMQPTDLEYLAVWWALIKPYFMSPYFWFTTLFIAIPLSLYTAWTMDEERP